MAKMTYVAERIKVELTNVTEVCQYAGTRLDVDGEALLGQGSRDSRRRGNAPLAAEHFLGNTDREGAVRDAQDGLGLLGIVLLHVSDSRSGSEPAADVQDGGVLDPATAQLGHEARAEENDRRHARNPEK